MVLFIMTAFAVVHAADVSENNILTAARKWIADNAVFQAELPNAVPTKAIQMTDADGKAMPLWRVDLKPVGYLVMSADDTLPPVVAFNTKGTFDLPEGHPMPALLERQSEIFQTELGKPQTRGNELAEENKARWNALLNRTRAETITPSTIVTAPLITTEWNQRAPYNYFCPTGSSYVERAVTGCVPTAIAQMLKYHEWPIAGNGTKTYTDTEGNIQKTLTADFSIPYNWNAMTDIYTQKEERDYGAAELSVARLIMEMGVLVEADYELNETGAYSSNINTLLAQYLGYSSSIAYGDSRSGYIGYIAQPTLYSRIRSDMVEGRPAIVSYSQETAGHCFITDGLGTMGSLDYYHFNYGWGGSENGWYLLTDGYESTVISSATTNIQPQPVAVFKPMSCEQASSFTLSWDFPKRIAVEAFRLTKTTGTRASTVISSSIAGSARSYNLTGQSGTATYTLEAKVNGEWQAASDSVTITAKADPADLLELPIDGNLKSIAGKQVSTTITANNSLSSLTITSNRPDVLPTSGITVTGNGTSRTVRLTPASGAVGTVLLYITATDAVGNMISQTVPLAVMADEPLIWYMTKAEAMAIATESGKLVLMVVGHDNCPNTNFFRKTVCETSDIKANLLENYVLWYANINVSGSSTGSSTYSSGLGGTYPFVAIINPADQSRRLRGHGGYMDIATGRAFLNIHTPYFSLEASEIYALGTTQNLELSVLVNEAEIRYTIDSTEPTAASTLYSGALSLTATTTVSARAFVNGEPVGDTVVKTYTFLEQVATPVLSKRTHDYFEGSCLLSVSCATPGATVRYTTNLYYPTASDAVFPADGLTITEDTIVLVRAFMDGMKQSDWAVSELYAVNKLPAAQAVVTGADVTMYSSISIPWTLQTTTYYSEPSAMQSGSIGHSSMTALVAKVNGPGSLSFRWRVSSQASYDRLTVYVDGISKTYISGAMTSWSQKTYTVTGEGEHWIAWEYSKNASDSDNDDCAWVDDIMWTPEKTLVEIVITGDNSIAASGTAAYTCTATWSDGTTSLVTPTWSLSSTTYASVDENGVVTNKNTTTTDKTVTLNASYMGMTAEPKDITLKGQAQPIILVSIAIDGPASIATASTATCTCTATRNDGTTTPVKPTWTFDPTTTYASVSTTGEVVNKNTETTDKTVTLKASYTDNGVTKTDSKGITLAKKELTGVSIVGPDRIAAEGTATYTCTASWTYGESTTETPTWTVEPSAYATIDSTGKVTNKNTTTTDQTVTLNASYTVNGITKTDKKDDITLKPTTPDNSYSLTVINGTGGGKYEAGASVTVIAVAPTDDYVFDSWNVEGITLTETQLKETMLNIEMPTNDVTLTANFLYEYSYTISNDMVTITKYNGNKEELVIPSSIEGKPVAIIGEKAFLDCNSLKRVTIPEGVLSISNSVFYNCINLISIQLPTTMNIIGGYAFYNCSSLTTVTIPEGVTSIDQYTFCKCSSLESVTISSNVTSIGKYAFAYCGNLVSIIIPENVKTISLGAFSSCTNLTSVIIPESVTRIDQSAFSGCRNLTSVIIPKGVTNIGDDAFAFCRNLASIIVDSNNVCYTSDSGILFTKDKTTLVRYPPAKIDTNYSIPSSVTFIGGYAFEGAENLISVSIPDGVTSIGRSAFEYCSNLVSINIPEKVTSIGSSAFYQCGNLTSVAIPDGVTTIGDRAFAYCSNLIEISIPRGVTSIREWTFCECSNLISVTISEGVKGIGYGAFSRCNCLSSVSLPSSVTFIANEAFADCHYLTSVTISSSVTSIGSKAFSNCIGLLSLTMPSSVKSIGERAFYGCSNLSEIEFEGGLPTIGNYCWPLSKNITFFVPVDQGWEEWSVPSNINLIFYDGTKNLVSISIIDVSSFIRINGEVTYECIATWNYGLSTLVQPIWTLTSSTYANIDVNGKVTNKNTTATYQTVTLNASYTVNGVTKTDSKDITLEGNGSPSIQTLELTAGWNWLGFNVLPENRNIGNVLGTAGFSANDSVQTNGDMCLFTGSGWFPGSFDIEYGRLYQIYVANAKTVVVHGEPCTSNEFPLTSGWNWIGNPMAAAISPSQLTHSGGWTAGDRIQSPDGNVMYMGDKWFPSNGLTLEPGKGCQIYTANSGTLTFPNTDGGDGDDALYVIVDLSGGPDATNYPVRYSVTGPDLNDDICRTTELWLRKIPAGTFIMGSPEDEVGRWDNETQHEVTLTQDYYMGVFECTQKQWELVMGSNPSEYKGDCRPVENVSHNMIRGTGMLGAGWPTYGHAVDATSFMGKLRAKTGLTFDLPTEAQWEYACRAGTTTALNSGKNLTNEEHDSAMDEVGRYNYNRSDGKGGYRQHTKVGSYLSNAWGLYDMHGNVWEWCLDWYNYRYGSYVTSVVFDPVGPSAGSNRVERGGGWNSGAYYWDSGAGDCRSASRDRRSVVFDGFGFRIVCLP